MGKVLKSSSRLTLEEVKAAIAFDQPKLRAARDGLKIHIGGSYLLFEDGAVANPTGPMSEFDIEIVLSDGFPRQEPKVFEVAERIPRSADRHVNPDGDCCVTVWEHWLACAGDHSFGAFLNGPVNEFFLGQYWFEKTGKWPFGERPHGSRGLEEDTEREEGHHLPFAPPIERLAQGALALSLRQREAAATLSQKRHDGSSREDPASHRPTDAPPPEV